MNLPAASSGHLLVRLARYNQDRWIGVPQLHNVFFHRSRPSVTKLVVLSA